MKGDQVCGAWLQLAGELKRRWARFTHDDGLLLEGTKDVFLGKLRQRSGRAREEAERQLEALIARVESRKKPQDVVALSVG